MLAPWKKNYDKPRQHIKKQTHCFANKGPSSQSYGFSSSHEWIWQVDHKESWALKNRSFELCCWRRLLESLGLQDQISQFQRRSILNIHWRDWCWGWSSNMLATWCKELTHWKRPWRWERLKAGGERDDRGWDGWIASPTQWTWVWVNSRSWWWTGRPGVLQSMGLQGVRHDRATELNRTEPCYNKLLQT